MSTRSGIMSRREALAVLASSAAWCASGCGASQDDAPTERDVTGWYALDLSEHPELEVDGGWVSVSETESLLHVNVVRVDEETFAVVWRVCTHGACYVDFDAEREVFWCACHDSGFDLDGQVLWGPAPRELRELEWVRRGDTLYIEPPGATSSSQGLESECARSRGE